MKLRSEGKFIDQFADQRLAEMWCELNRWGWPKEIPSPELKSVKEEHSNPRRAAFMHDIANKIGIKACLREWNRETMTDDEFEAWWRVNRRAA